MKTPPFSANAQLEAGFLLRRLQKGETLGMPHSPPMPSVGRGCHELRVVDKDRTWRVVHALEPDAVVILDVFAKKTAATPKKVIDVCTARLAVYRAARDR